MLRRIISAVALVALASAPAVARSRLFCRYTGVEITDCAEQATPDRPTVQLEGCCNREITKPIGAVLSVPHPELALRALGLPATAPGFAVLFAPRAADRLVAARPTGQPVYLAHRALLN